MSARSKSSNHTLELNLLQISKTKLAAIPRDDRNLLFMLAHIADELMSLSRFLQFATNYETEHTTIGRAQSSQAMLIARLFAGKCNEAWEFTRKIFLESELGKNTLPLLEQEGRDAFEELKRYFGKNPMLNRLRNEFAFHYPTKEWSDTLDAGFEKIEEDECEFYVSKTYLNTYWYGAEAVLTRAMIARLDGGDAEKALDRIIVETIDVANWLCTFFDFTIGAMLVKHLGINPLKDSQTITLQNVPDRDTVQIPVFVSVPEKR